MTTAADARTRSRILQPTGWSARESVLMDARPAFCANGKTLFKPSNDSIVTMRSVSVGVRSAKITEHEGG